MKCVWGQFCYTIVSHGQPHWYYCLLRNVTDWWALTINKMLIRSEAANHQSLQFVLKCSNWLQVWKLAHEPMVKAFWKVLGGPLFGVYYSLKCKSSLLENSYLEHLLDSHSKDLRGSPSPFMFCPQKQAQINAYTWEKKTATIKNSLAEYYFKQSR